MNQGEWPILRQVKDFLRPRKLFSIITPVYNCGSKIERTINSVWSQRKSLFEHVIVDGGSQDNTLPMIRRNRHPIRLVSENDSGVYDAMNKGISLAEGKYLYFLGAGDRLQPGILEGISEAMPADELALVYGDVFWEACNKVYDGEFSKEKIKTDNICHQAIFYGREIFGVVGKFETRFNTLADYALNIKCFGNEQIVKHYISRVIATYEGGGLSDQEIDQNFWRERPELIKAFLD